MRDWETIDFFTDESLVEDPYPYFDELRSAGPVLPLAHLGVVAVTGYDEASEVYHDPDTFSSCNSVVGPYATFPVPLEGDDVSDVVARYRDQLPMHEHMVTMDPPDHTRERALLMRLITPKRLKDNEAFMWRLADQQLDEFVADGRCEFINAYAQPFAMLVVADLLGVPEADHQRFREGFGLIGTVGEVGAGEEGNPGENALALARRVVHRVHRGPAARAAPRRAHRPGVGDIPRRDHAGRDRGRADVDVPVRGRPGDHRPPARRRAEAAGRAPRAAGRAAGEPRADPELPRRGAAGREPGEDRLPPRPSLDDDRRGRDPGRARR